MAVSSSSYSFSQNDVFISFRGKDTRNNFTRNLYAALLEENIRINIDYNLKRGDMSAEAIFKAIEESRVSVVVLSENYASSSWCLDELVKINECRKKNGQIVIPVFYKIEPKHVRKQMGTYGDAFDRHKQMGTYDLNKVQKWKDALTEIGNLQGLVNGLESEFIVEIVQIVLKIMTPVIMTAHYLKNFVGIERRVNRVESLLAEDDVRIVGIWGIGGVGKTTIASAVYYKIQSKSKFDFSYFAANVRENSMKNGLQYIQEELFSNMLNKRTAVSRQYFPYFIERFCHKKVLIVLDDVSDFNQVYYLVGRYEYFGFGSRIILTTRDRHILDRVGVKVIHHVEELDWNEALELFSLRAFDQIRPPEAFTYLSERIVHHVTGLPSMLNLLASLLHGRSMEEWKRTLEKMENGSSFKMFDLLRTSYDGLDDSERSLFLDIACFFNGEDLDFVKRIGDDSEYFTDIGIPILMEKSLVNVSNNIIEVHASLRDMAQEIIRCEHLEEPGKRSRLWDPEQVHQIFRCNSGTNAVEGIFLDMSKLKEMELSHEAFARMSKLRLLKFYTSSYSESCKLCLPRGLDSLPQELRYLHWHGYPLNSLPSRSFPTELVELHLPHSKVEELWEGIQYLPHLYKIDLSYSRQLIGIPDLSRAPKLQIINLEFCTSLVEVHASINCLNKLKHLNLKWCENLERLPGHINLPSLEVLDIRHCSSLQMFPVVVGNMENIASLVLDGCKSLKTLPRSIHMLKALTNLSLDDCSKLEDIPDIFESMVSLKSLRLKGTAMNELPLSVSHLGGLKNLCLDMCKNIKFLPVFISSLKWLETLSLSGCEKIEKLPSLAGLSSVVELNLSGCCNLLQIPEDIGCLSSLSNLSLKGSKIVNLPASIKRLSQLYRLDLTDCTSLEGLPELPPFLQYLYATNCISLTTVSSSKVALTPRNLTEDTGNNLDNIQLFDFTGCLELDQESCSNIMVDAQIRIQHMAKLSRKLSPSVTICFPGNEIPDFFAHGTEGSCLTMNLSSGWFNDRFLGFALCVVSEFKGRALVDFRLQCGFKINDSCIQKYNSPCLWYGTRFVDSHHTLIWYDHAFHNQTMKEIKSGYCTDEISFDFSTSNGDDFVYSWEVTKCGICLLYEQELHEEEYDDDDDGDYDDEEEYDDNEEEVVGGREGR